MRNEKSSSEMLQEFKEKHSASNKPEVVRDPKLANVSNAKSTLLEPGDVFVSRRDSLFLVESVQPDTAHHTARYGKLFKVIGPLFGSFCHKTVTPITSLKESIKAVLFKGVYSQGFRPEMFELASSNTKTVFKYHHVPGSPSMYALITMDSTKTITAQTKLLIEDVDSCDQKSNMAFEISLEEFFTGDTKYTPDHLLGEHELRDRDGTLILPGQIRANSTLDLFYISNVDNSEKLENVTAVQLLSDGEKRTVKDSIKDTTLVCATADTFSGIAGCNQDILEAMIIPETVYTYTTAGTSENVKLEILKNEYDPAGVITVVATPSGNIIASHHILELLEGEMLTTMVYSADMSDQIDITVSVDSTEETDETRMLKEIAKHQTIWAGQVWISNTENFSVELIYPKTQKELMCLTVVFIRDDGEVEMMPIHEFRSKFVPRNHDFEIGTAWALSETDNVWRVLTDVKWSDGTLLFSTKYNNNPNPNYRPVISIRSLVMDYVRRPEKDGLISTVTKLLFEEPITFKNQCPLFVTDPQSCSLIECQHCNEGCLEEEQESCLYDGEQCSFNEETCTCDCEIIGGVK